MTGDLRLAWLLTRGSDRREWWRVALTAVGSALATGLGLAAVAVASVHGQVHRPYFDGLLNQPGQRAGVVVTLLLLWVPVLGLLGQCARIGAVHRDRRMAGLRLAGATPAQVRRIAALESGPAALPGSVLVTAAAAFWLPGVWERPPAAVWAGFALVALAVPLLAVLVSVVALRRVVASPLGQVRRVRPRHGRAAVLAVVVPAALVGLAALLIAVRNTGPGAAPLPPLVFSVVVLTGAGAVAVTGLTARATGRLLAARTGSPAVLLAAERLRADPWATARTHAAVLLVAVVGVGFVGVRDMFLDFVHHPRDGAVPYGPDQVAFYLAGVDLAGAAVLVALLISLGGLAVGTAESLATRRRGLAAQAAAGVPRRVLGRALLLETALPLAPAMLLAGAGGTAAHLAYGAAAGAAAVPVLPPLLVPVAVYAACLLAAATSLPLLRRSTDPAELRFA
ncbi:hypothetical protein QFZ75_005033 [Streptomyces sp. V3I8]|uniref:FtsX-like permease family protein n=1 Tax=Streptomyces sp. V3I8 TaxID=3042279 RepID=UPI0027854F99|nr:FtsX-like permease family protein [Streptomyces sp. V3I8]MDQ1038617.1 hypothetical protein [Streptomyces sp. V3I8]